MPVPLKKSALRDGSCPKKSTDNANKSSKLQVLRSSSTELKDVIVEKKSLPKKKKEERGCAKQKTIVSCKHCGKLLKSANSPTEVCNCRKSVVTVKVICKKSTINLLSKYNDHKLHSSPVVAISSKDRMKAESATMKLRKGQRIGEISNKSKVAKEESEDDIEDSLSLFSQSDESEDDDDFQPIKTSLRKKPKVIENKTKTKKKFVVVNEQILQPTFKEAPKSDVEDDHSSSESLPDIPCPTSGPVKTIEPIPINQKNQTNGSGSSGAKRNQTKLQTKIKSSKVSTKTMGSNQTKPRRSSDDKVKSKATGNVRSLRSTDGHNNFAVEPSSSNSKSNTKVVRTSDGLTNSTKESSSSSKSNTKVTRTNESFNNFDNEPSTSNAKSNTKVVRTNDGLTNSVKETPSSKLNTKLTRRLSTSSPQRTTKSRNTSSSPSKSPQDIFGYDGVGSIKPGSVSHSSENEKSYSLRCLEKKTAFVAGSPDTDSRSESYELRTPIRSNSITTPQRPITPRGRGRPRKTPISEINHTVTPGTESSTPLTRSQRRATQIPDGEPLDKKPKLSDETGNNNNEVSSEESVPEPKPTTNSVKTDLPSSLSKQSRDAIALRARQSKIMAKSRVLQSNRNHSAAMKVFREMRKEEEQKQKLRHYEPGRLDSLKLLPSLSEHYQSDVDMSLCSPMESSSNFTTKTSHLSNRYVNNVSTSLIAPSSTSLALVKKAYPKARCDLCNMTFTRRFSLTKHLQTIQHQKMVQRMNAMSSQGLQRAVSEVPKLIRERRPHTLTPRISSKDLPRRDNDDLLSVNGSGLRDKLMVVEGNGYQSEEGMVFSDTNQHESNDEDFEEDQPEPEVEEWKSGKTLGRNDFVCEICEEKFTEKVAFGEHLWNHREDASLTCSVCNKHFEDSDNYNQHIDSAHLENTKFCCQYCPSKFNREDYLKKHVTSHRRNRNQRYVCSVCDKRFSRKTLLMRHFDAKHFALGRQRVELACDEDSDELPRHSKIPEVIAYDGYYSDDDDLNLYYNDDQDSDQDEFMDQMPSIDLEEADRLPVSSNGPHDRFSSNDPIPMITPEDYGRELPVENMSRINFEDRGRMSQSQQGSSSRGSPAFRSETNIRLGCGFRNGRSRVSGNDNPLTCLDCGKYFENRKYLLKHVEHFSKFGQKLKLTHNLKRSMQRHTTVVHKNLLKKSQNIGSTGTRRSPQFLKHRKLVPRTLPKLLPILPNNKERNPQEFLASSKPSPSTSTAVKKTTRPSSSLPPLSKIGLASQQPQPLQIATGSSTNDPKTHRVGVLSRITKSPSKTEVCRPLHTCELCSKAFTEIQTLSIHMWFHQNENLFSCPDCEAKCERKSDLDLHYKCHENEQPFFLCYVCFKPFRWKKDMIRHVRKKHPAERTYRCLYCSERFSKNDELTVHIAKSHPEHRSFLCTICGRRYAQRRYLLVHYQTQHNIDPEGQQLEVQDGINNGNNSTNNIMMGNYYGQEESEPMEMEIDIGSFLQTEHRM